MVNVPAVERTEKNNDVPPAEENKQAPANTDVPAVE
jgi:hypothetical protein